MASDDHVTALNEHAPLLLVTDIHVRIVQSGVLFLPGETSEAGAARIAVRHEELLPMEYRGIRRATVVSPLQGEPPKVGDEGFGERRVADAIEVGIHQVRDPRLAASEFHQGGAVDGARELSAAALVDPKHGRQMSQSAVMDVQRVTQDFPDRPLGAGAVDGPLVARRVQKTVGFRARPLVRAEERRDVVPQAVGQTAELGSFLKGGERQIDEEIVPPGAPDGLPTLRAGDAANESKRPRDAPEDIDDRAGGFDLELEPDGKPAVYAQELDQRLQDIPAFPKEVVGERNGRNAARTGRSVGEKGLLGSGVAEDVEDPGGGRYRGNGRSSTRSNRAVRPGRRTSGTSACR